jgi:hypothetical protein
VTGWTKVSFSAAHVTSWGEVTVVNLRYRRTIVNEISPAKLSCNPARAGAVSDIRIRFATPDDAGLLLQLIRQLAAYERAPNAVVATEEDLRRYGFGGEGL